MQPVTLTNSSLSESSLKLMSLDWMLLSDMLKLLKNTQVINLDSLLRLHKLFLKCTYGMSKKKCFIPVNLFVPSTAVTEGYKTGNVNSFSSLSNFLENG